VQKTPIGRELEASLLQALFVMSSRTERRQIPELGIHEPLFLWFLLTRHQTHLLKPIASNLHGFLCFHFTPK
jgi:hypothetical protein